MKKSHELQEVWLPRPVRFFTSKGREGIPKVSVTGAVLQIWCVNSRGLKKLVAQKRFPESLRKKLEEMKLPEGPLRNLSQVAVEVFSLGVEYSGAVILLDPSKLETFFLHEALRKAVGDSLKARARLEVDLSGLEVRTQITILRALGNLVELSTFRAASFGKKAAKPARLNHELEVYCLGVRASLQDEFEEGRIEGRATNLVRFLADLPGNALQPTHYREMASKIAGQLGCEVKFLGEKELRARGAGAFLAVARAVPGSSYGILNLRYRPKKKSRARVALVGKGLCFDTGGYNIKTSKYMLDMHRDMTGSAVALAVLLSCAERKVDYEVDVYLALAENLISPTAYRPNDVVLAANGLSIEVIDTDAEGRMALSDTLAIATESSPDLCMDFATLTGSIVRALDTRRSGVYGNDEKVLRRLVKMGDETGERVWPFPIGDDYLETLKSEVADIRQCSSSDYADHIYGATFLAHFVKEGTPWIHMDLAAEFNQGGLGLVNGNPTGFGVKITTAFLEAFAKDGMKKASH
jgi:leucyl aminopeptidase